ncbi:ATP-binding protein [Pseudovibrio exalbescens]|uniref:ATP-binding protein n=1 Tax=Pseudovibrio exalbescens TaxID=197461 RepID=UPI002365F6B1|nr:ATP-binding protein [Pseudovibrio exalbescens]MDD7909208.1 ATP-binding protein [Pseudovibrio exalbescens]
MSLLKRLYPRRMATQLILLLLVALLISQSVSFYLFTDERRMAIIGMARDNALWRTASIVRLIEDTPRTVHPGVLRAISNNNTHYDLGLAPLVTATGDNRLEQALTGFLKRRLKDDRDVRVFINYRESAEDEPPLFKERETRDETRRGPDRRRPEGNWNPHHAPDRMLRRFDGIEGATLYASIRLNNGDWLNFQSNFNLPPRPLVPVLLPILIMALFIVVIVWAFVYRLTRPLRALSDSAEQLGRGADVDPLPEKGPLEVRQVTRAFNEMQDRLTRFVKDRTRMLAAISHDLRTPITSLRIRAEFVEDAEDRERMIETLDEMQAMTEATLAFARDEAKAEETKQMDLSGLLESISNDYEDMGKDVQSKADERIVITCRPISLKRAFRNIIDNAVRYGTHAHVHVSRAHDQAVIEVRDEGPGIPEHKLNEVFEPFVRVEESRSEETGGIGLGLAICRSIIHAHGGTITLKNREDRSGLIVTVRLPL